MTRHRRDATWSSINRFCNVCLHGFENARVDFLTTLNGLHPSLKFTMELPADNMIPFIGIEIINNGTELETRVYRKPTNTGLLLHFQSHVDKRCKIGLLKTMLHRAYVLSSTTEAFNENVPSYALYSTDLITQLAS